MPTDTTPEPLLPGFASVTNLPLPVGLLPNTVLPGLVTVNWRDAET